MANFRILAYNVVDAAAITADPAMAATLPVTNLQLDTERERVARTTSLASQDVKLTWAANQTVNAIALARTNLTTGGTKRDLLYSDAAWTTGIHDSTALAAFSTSGLGAIDVATYLDPDFDHLRNSVYYLSELTNVRSAIVRLADAANPDGYMQATRLFMGKYFEVTYNPEDGNAELTLMDSGSGSRADDGTHIVSKGWKARRLVINLNWVPDADLPTLLAIGRYLGADRECFIDLYPGETGAKALYNRMACRLVQSPTLNPSAYLHHRKTMVFEET